MYFIDENEIYFKHKFIRVELGGDESTYTFYVLMNIAKMFFFKNCTRLHFQKAAYTWLPDISSKI
jgi:hypothetical protein